LATEHDQAERTPAATQQHGFQVRRTSKSQRDRAHSDYIACCNSSVKHRLGLGHQAVVSRTLCQGGEEKELRAICRVVVDDALPDTCVALDQSVRNAVGIRYYFDEEATFVGVNPLAASPRRELRAAIARLLGMRYLYMRAALADIPDMEKNLARMPPEAFTLLGIESGSRVVLETVAPQEVVPSYHVVATSIPAYELTAEIVDRRRTLEEPRLFARYPCPEALLDLPEDIWPIYLDAETRAALDGIRPLDVVKVRRDFWDLFQREFREFGVLFFISLFTTVSVLPVDKNWLNIGLISVASLIVASVVAMVNMRAKSGA
jgi:hypothetical protein